MKKLDISIAIFLLLQSFAGTATAIYFQRLQPESLPAIIPIYALSTLALVAGIGSLLNRSWARWLGVAVFAFQVVEIITPTWMYRLFLGVRLALSMGWIGQAEIGINFLALFVFAIAFRRAQVNNKPRT